jgi:catechol 2,3-dioxygenase-like lactoylglutathione lyase family enzyme
MRLVGVRLGVRDLDHASVRYAELLDARPVVVDPSRRWFGLERGAVELVADERESRTVLFAPDEAPVPAAFHGIDVAIAPPPADVAGTTATAIDHVVVFTPDPARAIALWRDAAGFRLAFDREFPERKVRLLFFRSGGITLELATALPAPEDPSGPDRFYGVSYRVRDLVGRRAALLAAGFDVSDIRPGNKAGTRVASVRSETAGVPTLLLEDEARR